MVYMEGKQQMIDLIGALQAKRQREQTEEDRKRKELENEMLQQQLKEQKWKFDASMSPATVAVLDSSPYGGTHKKFLHEIGGVGLPAGGGGGGGGGGRGGGGGGGQTQEQADLLVAQTDLADEQARIAQYQRQGRGGGGQPQQAPKGGGNPSQMLGLGGPNIDEGALRQSVMSGQAIQSPEGYTAGWDRDRNIENATRLAELEREKFLLGGGAMSDKIVPPEMQVDALAGKRAGDVQSARIAELRRLAFNKIKGDPYLSTAPAQVQQAAADFDDKQRSILSDVIGNAGDKAIQWDIVLRDIADGTLR